MGLKARLSSYCTKRANNGVNLVTSHKIYTRLARPIDGSFYKCSFVERKKIKSGSRKEDLEGTEAVRYCGAVSFP